MLAFGAVHHETPVIRELPLGGTLGVGRGGADNEKVAGACRARSRHATSLPAVSELVGASEETGGVFDPLGLATDEVGELINLVGICLQLRAGSYRKGGSGLIATLL